MQYWILGYVFIDNWVNAKIVLSQNLALTRKQFKNTLPYYLKHWQGCKRKYFLNFKFQNFIIFTQDLLLCIIWQFICYYFKQKIFRPANTFPSRCYLVEKTQHANLTVFWYTIFLQNYICSRNMDKLYSTYFVPFEKFNYT